MVMSSVQTTYGEITFPDFVTKKRRAAILRALGWCEQICIETGAWSAQPSTHGQRLVRILNGHELAVFLWSPQSWMPVERLVADLKTGICQLKSTGAGCASHRLRAA